MQQTTGGKVNSTGGAGFNSTANYGGLGLKTAILGGGAAGSQNQNENSLGGTGVIRPPLYVPQKRDAGRAATGMLSGAGI